MAVDDVMVAIYKDLLKKKKKTEKEVPPQVLEKIKQENTKAK